MMHDSMDAKAKMQSLMELIKEMRSMHGEAAKGEPKAMEVEIHEMHALPEDMENETPESEMEESPEHEASESPQMESAEHEEMPEESMEDPKEEASESPEMEASEDEMPEEDEDQHSPMNLPPAMLKLIMEHMKK